MKLNKKIIAVLSIGLYVGSLQIYAKDLNDVEFVEMTEQQKQNAKKAFEQNRKLAEQYGLSVTNEVSEIPIQVKVNSAPQVATNAQSDFRKSVTQQRDTEVWKKNNFLDMRLALEKLTNTQVTSQEPNGILYTTYGSDIYGGDWENRSTTRIDYLWGVGNKYMVKWMNDANNKKELAKIASMSFKDIKGNEWYASHIPTAVYYGLINGYPDGTFKGSAPVSRAEFAVMRANASRTFTAKEDVSFPSKLTAHKDQWYYTDMARIKGGPMGIYGLSVNDMNSGISRGEVAMVLARSFFDGEFTNEYLNLKGSSFKDITKVTQSLEEMSASEKRTEYMKQLKTPNSCPKEVVAALNVLKSKGLMAGDANGNSNWAKTVTRGEAIALFERCAQQIKTK